MFRFDKETKKLASVEPWSAEGKYDNYCVIGPFTSIYYSFTTLPSGIDVRNVHHSSGDNNPYGTSWLGLIKLIYEVKGKGEYYKEKCWLNKYHYYKIGNMEIEEEVPGHVRCMNIKGGHITADLAHFEYDELQYFLLLPICDYHNNWAQNDYYFKVEDDVYVVVMETSKSLSFIQPALLIADSAEADGDIEFDVKKYCEENGVEVKDMYFN